MDRASRPAADRAGALRAEPRSGSQAKPLIADAADLAARLERAEAAQLNLFRQAERDREARRRAEEALDLIAPWVAKFAAAVEHYNRTPPRYAGSQFTLEPDPGYRPALAASVHGQVPLNGPTISDLRFLAAAYASAMSAGTAETAQQAQGRSPASATGEAGDAQSQSPPTKEQP